MSFWIMQELNFIAWSQKKKRKTSDYDTRENLIPSVNFKKSNKT